MICLYCNTPIPDGSEICPCCNKKIDISEKRCPDCWTRISPEDVNCPKCGCHIEDRINELQNEANMNPPGITDKIKKLPRWLKIAVPAFVIVLVLSLWGYNLYLDNKKNEEAAKRTDDFVISVDMAVDKITKMAQTYEDMVYGQSWLDHTGSAAAVREVYAKEINLIKDMREPIEYQKKQIEECDKPELTSAASQVYNCYKRCYSYVIGENGRYPTYIEKYKELLADYDSALEELVKTAESID